MTGFGDDRGHLEARNAAMREQVDQLLDSFQRQTAQLRDAQSTAAATSATVTSKDGLVRATVDASGALTELTFAPSAFERSTPEALARTVLDVVRRGGARVRQEITELMAPLTGDMPDLSDLVEGAPSLRGLLPTLPTPPAEHAPAPARGTEDRDGESVLSERHHAPAPQQPQRPRPRGPRPDDADIDEPRETWLTGGRD